MGSRETEIINTTEEKVVINDTDAEMVKADVDKYLNYLTYLDEFNKLSRKLVTNINSYLYRIYFETPSALLEPQSYTDPKMHTVPSENENVSVCDNSYNELNERVLLSVCKPEYEPCPQPSQEALSQIDDSFEDFEKELTLKSDDSSEALTAYIDERNNWVLRQKDIKKARELFDVLYDIYTEMNREGDSLELCVANGLFLNANLSISDDVVDEAEQKKLYNSITKYPLISKCVNIRFAPLSNTISIVDTEAAPKLNLGILHTAENLNLNNIEALLKDFKSNDYHPLDSEIMGEFLLSLSRELSQECVYVTDLTQNINQEYRYLIVNSPVFLLRRRQSDYSTFIDGVKKKIQNGGNINQFIKGLVEGNNEYEATDTEASVSEHLLSVGGESLNNVFSKTVNKEQLSIAQRLNTLSSAVIQGPPGCGKTYAITQFLVDCMTQGNTCIVTAHTIKSLSVLKNMLPKELQALCVSNLENSNRDMVDAVDSITDYISNNTAHQLKQELDIITAKRTNIYNQLLDVRKELYDALCLETIPKKVNGSEISISKIASYLTDNAELGEVIPGNVRGDNLPLTEDELETLYSTNSISLEDETEISNGVPNIYECVSPEEFDLLIKAKQKWCERVEEIRQAKKWVISTADEAQVKLQIPNLGDFIVELADEEHLNKLEALVDEFSTLEPATVHAIVDSCRGGKYKSRWDILNKKLNEAVKVSEELAEYVGTTLSFDEVPERDEILKKAPNALKKLKESYQDKFKGGKVKRFFFSMNKDISDILDITLVNDHEIEDERDCDFVIKKLRLDSLKKECAVYWNALIGDYDDSIRYEQLGDEAEQKAKLLFDTFNEYLEQGSVNISLFDYYLSSLGLHFYSLIDSTVADTKKDIVNKTVEASKGILKDIVAVLRWCEQTDCEKQIDVICNNILAKYKDHALCNDFVDSLKNKSVAKYTEIYNHIAYLIESTERINERNALLDKLTVYAPDWATAIKNREGIHGEIYVPFNITECWKWKICSQYYDDMISNSYSELQNKNIQLSKDFMTVSKKLAITSSWYHVLKRVESDLSLKQALIGWKKTIEKIGKGKGKYVTMHREKAKELMEKCQKLIPVWIMPISGVVENINPERTAFDVMIVDESSQADIVTLALTFMADKVVIVGDDKQVNPNHIGVEIDKIVSLQDMYIKNKIPNYHLYTAKTSIYDLASTTCSPIMLKEHFRCVPEIISFCNQLSYDNKIMHLRSADSTNVFPAIVPFKVSGTRKDNKTNPVEAKTIIAIIKACLEREEYKDKSFGVLSMLGMEQARYIQKLINLNFDPVTIKNHRLLSGTAPYFQGDERDVVLLSMVDSNSGERPLDMLGFGVEDSVKNRYNVSVSRAKDQLWVVHSLDPSRDLKSGDMRKRLIDYANAPIVEHTEDKALELELSEFEKEVFDKLESKDYHIEYNKKIGSYHFDAILRYGKTSVIVECDGEHAFASELDVRKTLEAHITLQRLGWKIIRVRASEYYRDKDSVMDDLLKKLNDYGVLPFEVVNDNEISANESIRMRALELMDNIRL